MVTPIISDVATQTVLTLTATSWIGRDEGPWCGSSTRVRRRLCNRPDGTAPANGTAGSTGVDRSRIERPNPIGNRVEGLAV